MEAIARRCKWTVLFISILIFGSVSLPAQDGDTKVENLAFKILQKQAAEYELALSNLISKSLGKYVPETRFHLSVRIYWNPHKINQLKLQDAALKQKSTKLPGFPVFIREEEKGLDYYMGAGSVMKLKVEVLVDDKLPARYTDFIYQMVPIQARFVAERGDTVTVTPIPFPETPDEQKAVMAALDKDIPLAGDDASAALLKSIEDGKRQLDEMEPVILHPVLQRYITDYEKFLTAKLKELVGEYVEQKHFLLSTKFYWNPEEINNLKALVTKTDVDGKVKLPGFSVYVEERESLYEMMANSTTLMKIEISVMLDESVSPEVEPFLKKLIPMSIKIIPARGDKLVIFRGHFPKIGAELQRQLSRKSDKSLQTDMEYENEISQAFYAGEYRRSLVLVDLLLAKKTDPYERLPLLKKKGSLHLLLQEKELARAAWEEAKRINPDSENTVEFLKQID
jgi:hypothetical protein